MFAGGCDSANLSDLIPAAVLPVNRKEWVSVLKNCTISTMYINYTSLSLTAQTLNTLTLNSFIFTWEWFLQVNPYKDSLHHGK